MSARETDDLDVLSAVPPAPAVLPAPPAASEAVDRRAIAITEQLAAQGFALHCVDGDKYVEL
jgi:hypothetical protein